MKKYCSFILGIVFATRLCGQQAANPVPAVPAVPLSPETLAKIERMTPLFDGKSLEGWLLSVKGANGLDPASAWTVKDGVMASLGAGRSALYTKSDYGDYRLIFTMRHVSGGVKKDHRACVLIYCIAPGEGEKALDALGGIQFQPPNGGSWDYRPGKNNGGKGLFTRPVKAHFNEHEWSQVEILVHTNGAARMAVAQPPGAKAVEVLDFNDPTAGRRGPIAWQMHNDTLMDEYKDVRIETDPKEDKLITVE